MAATLSKGCSTKRRSLPPIGTPVCILAELACTGSWMAQGDLCTLLPTLGGGGGGGEEISCFLRACQLLYYGWGGYNWVNCSGLCSRVSGVSVWVSCLWGSLFLRETSELYALPTQSAVRAPDSVATSS